MRKFENFWIFELACGPGSRKFENQKFTDVCENLPIFAKICTILRKYADFFAKTCRFLRKFTDFCDNMPIFAKICRFSPKFVDFCENLSIFCENLQFFFAKIRNFCENLQIFAKMCQFLRSNLGRELHDLL